MGFSPARGLARSPGKCSCCFSGVEGLSEIQDTHRKAKMASSEGE